MRIRHKKTIVSAVAAVTAGIFGAGALIQSSVAVQASSAMMPGIETIVQEDETLKILELVDNSEEAEIGYYISGQEPYLKLYRYTYTDADGTKEIVSFSTVEEALGILPENMRTQFMLNVSLDADGNIDTTASTGIKMIYGALSGVGESDADTPLSYTEYQEKYFLSDGDDAAAWTRIDFSDGTRSVKLNGSYVETEGGDYVEEDAEYYPIRSDVEADSQKTEKYRENIENFSAVSGEDEHGSYHVVFSEVSNEDLEEDSTKNNNTRRNSDYDYANGGFGYYENTYAALTEDTVNDIDGGKYTFPGEDPENPEDSVKIYENTTPEVQEASFDDGGSGIVEITVPGAEETEAESGGTAASEAALPEEDFSTGEDTSGADSAQISASDDAESGEEVISFEQEAVYSQDSAEVFSSDAESGGTFESAGADTSEQFADSGTADTFSGESTQSEVTETIDTDSQETSGTESADIGSGESSEAAVIEEGGVSSEAAQTEETGADSFESAEIIAVTEETADSAGDGTSGTQKEYNGRKYVGEILGLEGDTDKEKVGTQADPLIYYGKTIDQFPNYKYTLVGDLAYIKQQLNTTTAKTAAGGALENGDIIKDENGQYFYILQDETGTAENMPLYIVTGRQAVSYDNVKTIAKDDETGEYVIDYNYYYRVSEVYFCCREKTADGALDPEDYQYTGWYYPGSYGSEGTYLSVTVAEGAEESGVFNGTYGTAATHYISDRRFRLTTEGEGTYKFVEDESAGEQLVEVTHFFYRGGYKNNDWFKKYVFHLEDGSGDEETQAEFDNFKLEVDTRYASDFGEVYVEHDESEAGTSVTEEEVPAGGDAGETAPEILVEDTGADAAEGAFTDEIVTETEAELTAQDTDSGTENDAISAGTEPEAADTGAAEPETTDTEAAKTAPAVDETAAAEAGAEAAETVAAEAGAEAADTAAAEATTAETAAAETTAAETAAAETKAEAETTAAAEFADMDAAALLTTDSDGEDNTDAAGEEAIVSVSDAEDAGTETKTTETDTETESALFSEEDTDAAGDGEETTTFDFDDYDLIYVNGALSADEMTEIIKNSIPCIINTRCLGEDTNLTEALTTYMDSEDADEHYVNKYLYFFTNTVGTKEESADYNLLNLRFHTDFNEGDTAEGTDSTKGFEEILEYIESENQYREIENDVIGDDEADDGDITSGGETDKGGTELLSFEISQARAIEYILNHRYERTVKAKDTVSVLEIEPAKSNGELTQKKVWKWLGYTDEQIAAASSYISGVSYSACCYNTNNGEYNPINYAYDNKESTFWISDWKSGHENNKSNVGKYRNGNAHYITISGIPENAVVNGVSYTPRDNTKSISGTAVWLTVYVYDKEGGVRATYEYKNLTVKQEEKRLDFSESYEGSEIGYIDVVFMQSYVGTTLKEASDAGSSSGTYASCAEIRLCGGVTSDGTMTTLPDIELTTMTASEFVGHVDDLNTEYDLIYIGDDDSFRETASNKTYAAYIMGNDSMLYTHVGAASCGFYPSIGGVNYLKLVGLLDIDYVDSARSRIKSLSLFNTGEGSGDGAGSFRGSGNDITEQQYKALEDFVNSGYPVVLADSLVSSGGINKSTVDDSSWYYKFMSKTLEKDNVVTVSEAEQNKIEFFANIAKPVIKFELDENGDECKPPEPSMGDSDVLTGVLEESDEGLEYRFKIGNDSEVLPASASYDCKLYLDLNFDGNFGSDEDQLKYIEIVDEESGSVLTTQDGKYQLELGKTYKLTRKIPSDYYKIIEWKLEVKSNTNASVRTSEIGYAKRRTTKTQVINVLQIIPTKRVSWNLSEDYKNKNGVFHNCLEYVKNYYGFDIQITTVTIDKYAKSAETARGYLSGKQMVILGFADAYSNIPNDEGQVDLLVEFAKSGKSVIFSHDTTSSVNVDVNIEGKLSGTTAETTEAGEHVDNHFFNEEERNMGLSLNTRFRFIAGLDRYGIMDTGDYVSADSSGLTVSDLIKRGVGLSDGDVVEGSKVSFDRLMDLVGDVAFETGSGRNSSFLQTQGYINSQLQNSTMGSYTTTTVTQVNEGVITNYPYKIGNDDGTLTVGTTHAQSYQLALEADRDINGNSDGVNDVVVWYCLGGNAEYTQSPNDARNNYYFYSRGNIIYTGAGHGKLNDDEKKLFINAMVAAANVAAVEPEVSFISSLDPAAETETVRYYSTDQSKWISTEETNVVEQDMTFYVNVKEYNMVSQNLNGASDTAENLTLEFYVEAEDGAGDVQYTNGSETISLKKLSGLATLKAYNGSTVTETNGTFVIPESSAYSFELADVENYLRSSDGLYKASVRIYVKATSTVNLYGSATTQTDWSYIDLKQRQLFDLD